MLMTRSAKAMSIIINVKISLYVIQTTPFYRSD